MEELIANNVQAYGELAVFLLLMLSGVGVPLGEEVIIIPAAALVEAGQLSYWPVLVATYLGVVGSDLLWFLICSRYGTRLLHKRAFKRLVHPRRLLEAKHQMEKRGAWMIVMARFIPGSRTTAITVSGMLHMPFWKFAPATILCVLITAPIQVWVGRLGARMTGAESITEVVRLTVGFIVLMLALSITSRIWRAHRVSRKRAPRAKARWLRRFRIPGRSRKVEGDKAWSKTSAGLSDEQASGTRGASGG